MNKVISIIVILIIYLAGCKTSSSKNAEINNYNTWNAGNNIKPDLLSDQDKADGTDNNKNYKNTDVLYDKKLEIPYTIPGYLIRCYCITESKVYIGTDEGLFVTEDRGKTWELFDQSLMGIHTGAIYVDEFETFYLSTALGLKVYSTKQKQWIMNVPQKAGTCIYVDGDMIILGSIKNSVDISYDYGKTWERKEKLLPEDILMGATASNIGNVVGYQLKIFILSSNSAIGVSLDRGKTWKEIRLNIYTKGIRSICIFQNLLYLNGGDGNIYSSNDDGISWKKEIIDKYEIFVYSMATTNSEFHLLTNRGVYKQKSGKWQFVGPDILLNCNYSAGILLKQPL